MDRADARKIVHAVARAMVREGLPIDPADLHTGFDSGVRLGVLEPELALRWLEAQQIEIFAPQGATFPPDELDSLARNVADAIRAAG